MISLYVILNVPDPCFFIIIILNVYFEHRILQDFGHFSTVYTDDSFPKVVCTSPAIVILAANYISI